MNLVLLARGLDALSATAADLQSRYGIKAVPVAADITKTDSVKAAADAAKVAFGIGSLRITQAFRSSGRRR